MARQMTSAHRAFTDLELYLQANMRVVRPQSIITRIREIQTCFVSTSHTYKLAQQVITCINLSWNEGTLTRFQLVSHAFLMMYDKYTNVIQVKRKLIEAEENGGMHSKFSPPGALNAHNPRQVFSLPLVDVSDDSIEFSGNDLDNDRTVTND